MIGPPVEERLDHGIVLRIARKLRALHAKPVHHLESRRLAPGVAKIEGGAVAARKAITSGNGACELRRAIALEVGERIVEKGTVPIRNGAHR